MRTLIFIRNESYIYKNTPKKKLEDKNEKLPRSNIMAHTLDAQTILNEFFLIYHSLGTQINIQSNILCNLDKLTFHLMHSQKKKKYEYDRFSLKYTKRIL